MSLNDSLYSWSEVYARCNAALHAGEYCLNDSP